MIKVKVIVNEGVHSLNSYNRTFDGLETLVVWSSVCEVYCDSSKLLKRKELQLVAEIIASFREQNIKRGEPEYTPTWDDAQLSQFDEELSNKLVSRLNIVRDVFEVADVADICEENLASSYNVKFGTALFVNKYQLDNALSRLNHEYNEKKQKITKEFLKELYEKHLRKWILDGDFEANEEVPSFSCCPLLLAWIFKDKDLLMNLLGRNAHLALFEWQKTHLSRGGIIVPYPSDVIRDFEDMFTKEMCFFFSEDKNETQKLQLLFENVDKVKRINIYTDFPSIPSKKGIYNRVSYEEYKTCFKSK